MYLFTYVFTYIYRVYPNLSGLQRAFKAVEDAKVYYYYLSS